jgi:hypothetical protein
MYQNIVENGMIHKLIQKNGPPQCGVTNISYIRTLFKAYFIQDFSLLKVQFRQVYIGFQFIQGSV